MIIKSIACVLVALAIQATGAEISDHNGRILIKRQASMSSAAMAQVSAATPNNNASRPPASVEADAALSQPNRNKLAKPVEASLDEDDRMMVVDQQAPSRATGNQRKPMRNKPMRRPQNHVDYEDEEEEECYDDDDGGYNLYRPMMHMQRLMGSMFDQMQGMSSDAFMSSQQPLRGGRGGVGSSASAFSNGDGFSRTSSMVNNNGRTRGIVSETRNGRTKTRRFGDEDEDEEE